VTSSPKDVSGHLFSFCHLLKRSFSPRSSRCSDSPQVVFLDVFFLEASSSPLLSSPGLLLNGPPPLSKGRMSSLHSNIEDFILEVTPPL